MSLFDFFKISSPETIRQKFDSDTADIILYERLRVFWAYSWFWAIIGSMITLLILIMSR